MNRGTLTSICKSVAPALIVALLCVILVDAQEFRGVISGQVTDPHGGCFPAFRSPHSEKAHNNLMLLKPMAAEILQFPISCLAYTPLQRKRGVSRRRCAQV